MIDLLFSTLPEVGRRKLLAAGLPALLWILNVSAAPAAPAAGPAPVTVYAAASLADVLNALGERYTRATGVAVRHSFAASSVLARQIEAGAPADLYVSADEEWMDYLATRARIDPASRRDLVGNRLVFVAPAASTLNLSVDSRLGLRALLGTGRLALADPDSVPAGRYARAALQSLSLWGSVEDRLVRADNVRGALRFVAAGEAPLGLVYETDARIEPRVRIVGRIPESAHPPILYPAALLPGAGAAARAYLAYLGSAEAAAEFAAYGFRPPR